MIIGGEDSDENPYNDAQIVNLSNETSTCNNFPDYPLAIRVATGAIVAGHPIICGGISTRNNYSECYRHNKASDSWTFLTNMATERYNSASISVNGMMMVTGGWNGDWTVWY